MAKLTAAEKAQKKLLLEEKREARRIAKEQKEKEKEQNASQTSTNDRPSSNGSNAATASGSPHSVPSGPNYFEMLTPDFVHYIMTFLPARDLGVLTFCSKEFCKLMVDGRYPFVMSRLHRPEEPLEGAVGRINMCSNQEEARIIVKQSYGGGDTGRLMPKTKTLRAFANEFVSYARFLEEASIAYATQNFGGRSPATLPRFVNGRFVSVSPEHSVSRLGGGHTAGAGGSGVATWGIGKRGQLGHGRRQDQREPKLMVGGVGFGIRIVQVSAGGGLVRVAHTLLLTSTGRVLSFGTGQYGALGHGYSGGKQLPDVLRPQYVEGLAGVRCTCISAGELHSAAVTADGDLYTWGDGFTGQLGHSDKRPEVSPKQVVTGSLDEECVSMVSCGARHTLAVTEDGEVFSFGLGHFGVLGRSFTPFDHDADAALAGFADEMEGLAIAAALDEAEAENVPAIQPEQQNTTEPQVAEPPVNAAAELIAHLERIAHLSLEDTSDQCMPKIIDSMKSVHIVGASAGHRHSLFLDKHGNLYSCGAGISGCLGHGDKESTMVPMRIQHFDTEEVRIMQMSAGVDISMALTTTGEVFAWGKRDQGRIGLGVDSTNAYVPKKVHVESGGEPIKAVDVECGYVHSIIVGLNGTIHVCGGVGVFEEQDGASVSGYPTETPDFNIWHRIPEAKDVVTKQRWKKYGKYEVKGKRRMMDDTLE